LGWLDGYLEFNDRKPTISFMKTSNYCMLLTLAVFATGVGLTAAEGLDPALQAKVDAKIKEAQTWAADPVIVNAVKAHNATVPADQAAMTQAKWAALTVLDPMVRGFTKNEAAEFLKAKKTPAVTEAFVSDAAGLKVAFLAKTSNWCHKGKAKHDVPMTGKTWQGPVELDESTGQQQLQISVPVLDDGKPVGSVVIGLSVAKLGAE
jgi:hypothetical protein